MLRRVSLAIATILFLSSGAFAMCNDILAGSIEQGQNFTIGDVMNPGLSSSVNLVHGDAFGVSTQHVSVENINNAGKSCHFGPCHSGPCGPGPGIRGHQCCTVGCAPSACQLQEADVFQKVKAEGDCGVISVNGFVDAQGNQNQFIGSGTEMKNQYQGLGLAADQVLFRADGSGFGEALHTADLSQNQIGTNAAGVVSEASTIEACQKGFVKGAPNSTATLTNSLTVDTMQWQTVY
jgi:hypothetical protein